MTTWYAVSLLLLLVTSGAFVLNLPFGYFRAGVKKLSVKWFLYIHLPIPFIFILRHLTGLGAKFIPVIAVGAILGQIIGGRLNNVKAS